MSLALLLRLAPRLAADPVSFWLVAAAWPTTLVVLRYGQLSALSLFWLVVAVRLAARDWNLLAGLALGCLAYKPNLLVVPALVLLFAGQWRLLTGMLVGASAQIAASIAGVGWTAFAEYLRVLTTIAQHPEVVQLYPAESHSVAGQLRLWSAPVAVSSGRESSGRAHTRRVAGVRASGARLRTRGHGGRRSSSRRWSRARIC